MPRQAHEEESSRTTTHPPPPRLGQARDRYSNTRPPTATPGPSPTPRKPSTHWPPPAHHLPHAASSFNSRDAGAYPTSSKSFCPHARLMHRNGRRTRLLPIHHHALIADSLRVGTHAARLLLGRRRRCGRSVGGARQGRLERRVGRSGGSGARGGGCGRAATTAAPRQRRGGGGRCRYKWPRQRLPNDGHGRGEGGQQGRFATLKRASAVG